MGTSLGPGAFSFRFSCGRVREERGGETGAGAQAQGREELTRPPGAERDGENLAEREPETPTRRALATGTNMTREAQRGAWAPRSEGLEGAPPFKERTTAKGQREK